MSYEYYLQCYENQEPQDISTQKILEIFEPYIVRSDATYLDLEFDELNHCSRTATHLLFYNLRLRPI